MIAPPPPTRPTLRSVKPQVDLAPVPLVHNAHFLRPMDATLNFSTSWNSKHINLPGKLDAAATAAPSKCVYRGRGRCPHPPQPLPHSRGLLLHRIARLPVIVAPQNLLQRMSMPKRRLSPSTPAVEPTDVTPLLHV